MAPSHILSHPIAHSHRLQPFYLFEAHIKSHNILKLNNTYHAWCQIDLGGWNQIISGATKQFTACTSLSAHGLGLTQKWDINIIIASHLGGIGKTEKLCGHPNK